MPIGGAPLPRESAVRSPAFGAAPGRKGTDTRERLRVPASLPRPPRRRAGAARSPSPLPLRGVGQRQRPGPFPADGAADEETPQLDPSREGGRGFHTWTARCRYGDTHRPPPLRSGPLLAFGRPSPVERGVRRRRQPALRDTSCLGESANGRGGAIPLLPPSSPPTSTSDRTRPPAEFKHITKRRKRN